MRVAMRSAAPGVPPATLRACALFRAMDDAALTEVASLLRVRRFRRNEVVFHEGDPGDSLLIVDSGSVKVVLASPEGGEAIIATLRAGDFFGELALLDGAPRSATVVAIEPTVLRALGRGPFLDLVETRPDVRQALLTGLVAELRRLTRHVEEMHFLGLPGRLAMRLAELAREAAREGPGAELSWLYTQADLASMVGGSRQRVNQLLGDLSAEGLLRIERDTIQIPDINALARVAHR